MESIDVIIKVIDDNLIELGKDCFSLRQANQILVSEKIMTFKEKNNQELKKILEANMIPHAYQTETSPSQWYIPISPKGEKRLKTKAKKTLTSTKDNTPKSTIEYNRILCPNCSQVLIIPDELVNEDSLECLLCNTPFKNPLKRRPEYKQIKFTRLQRNWLIAIVVISILAFIGNNVEEDTSVKNNPYDASVRQVEHYLDDNLKDPDSYESLEWSEVNEAPEGSGHKYEVRHKYRSKNSYGGYVIENEVYKLDEKGNVVGIDDY